MQRLCPTFDTANSVIANCAYSAFVPLLCPAQLQALPICESARYDRRWLRRFHMWMFPESSCSCCMVTTESQVITIIVYMCQHMHTQDFQRVVLPLALHELQSCAPTCNKYNIMHTGISVLYTTCVKLIFSPRVRYRANCDRESNIIYIRRMDEESTLPDKQKHRNLAH